MENKNTEEIEVVEGQYNKQGIRYTYVYFRNLIITFVSNYLKETCKCHVSSFNKVTGIPLYLYPCKDFDEAEPVINKELILKLIEKKGAKRN